MKKGIIAVVVAAVLAAGGAGGYVVYKQKAEAKAFERDMVTTISNLPSITVFEKDEIPSVEDIFKGTEKMINLETVQPDISSVSTTEPGEYEVKYTFKDVKGAERTASVPCYVKPELSSHVTGMKDLEIDEGDAVPVDAGCSFDEYVNSVTLNTEMVDPEEAGTYDISYTILGADGDMKTVDGYTCTVNEVITPTPTPTPTPTEAPKKEKKKDKKPDKEVTEATEDANASENANAAEQVDKDAVGNVEVQQNVVATGDENNLIAIGGLIVLCLGVAVGAFVYYKKKKEQ